VLASNGRRVSRGDVSSLSPCLAASSRFAERERPGRGKPARRDHQPDRRAARRLCSRETERQSSSCPISGFVGSKRRREMAEAKPEEISHPPMEQLQGFEYCIDSNPPWGAYPS